MILEALQPLATPLERLAELAGNPRRGDVGAVARSYERFGQRKPIVARRTGGTDAEPTGEVLAGNHQLLAARQLGWESIAVVWVDDDDATASAFALADNRIAELGGYDDADLAALIAGVAEADAELLAASGWTTDDLAELVARLEPTPPALTDPDDVPEAPPAKTVPGDVWLCGPHRVMCGDATVPTDVETLMSGAQATLIYTDPPYGVSYVGGTTKREMIQGDDASGAALSDLFEAPFLAAAQVGASACGLMVWHAHRRATPLYVAAEQFGWECRAQIIWVKNQAQFGALGAHYHQKHEPCLYLVKPGSPPKWRGPTNEVTVWEEDRSRSNDWHPTQKPTALAVRAFTNHTDPGDVVLDLFGGSGSTLIAAHDTGRVAYLMELDPRYVDVICRRYQEHTGDKPIAESTSNPHDFTAD